MGSHVPSSLHTRTFSYEYLFYFVFSSKRPSAVMYRTIEVADFHTEQIYDGHSNGDHACIFLHGLTKIDGVQFG